MKIGVFEMYVMVAIFAIFIFLLRRDSTKYAETNNITKLDDMSDDNRREFIASGVTDYEYRGCKILVILYSLFCRKCDSDNIFAEIADTKEHIQVFCKDCGYTTLIPLKKLLIHETIDNEDGKSEEQLVKDYIRKVNKKHEIEVVGPGSTKKDA